MTTKQAEKIGKGLLPDLPGFEVTGKMMFESPVDDFLYGLFFDKTSDVNRFHFSVFFLPLFVPTKLVYFNYGKRVGNGLNWRLDNPNLLVQMRLTLRDEAMPFLAKVFTSAGVLKYLNACIESGRPHVNSHTLEAFAYTLIKIGDYSATLRALAEQQRLLKLDSIPWMVEQRDRAALVESKLRQHPKFALAQLEEWKDQTIRQLKLENYRS